jgi:uncharacterized protein YaaW (UPF0174 family)
MAYLEDEDLEFLGGLTDEELQPLFDILVFDSDGKQRHAESITASDEYKRYKPHHHEYWKAIAGELQCFGGNSIVNTFRGRGVRYREILTDVASRYISDYLKKNGNASTGEIELHLIKHLLEKYRGEILEELEAVRRQAADSDSNDIRDLIDDLDKKTSGFKSAALLAWLVAGRVVPMIGIRLISGIVAASALRAIGIRAGFSLVAGRAGSLVFGPVGWAVTGIWTVFDIAGPAYRVTVPAVVQIAFMRLKLNQTP